MTISLSTYKTPTTYDSLFDSLFDPFFSAVTIPTRTKAASKTTHVAEEEDKFIISVLAPGLDKEDFNISVTDGALTVAVENATTEFGTSSFSKVWSLPEGTTSESIAADYKQGILRLTVTKPEKTTPETTKIKVS